MIGELEIQQVFDDLVVTAVETSGMFRPAEEYQPEYLSRNPPQSYCTCVAAPKLEEFRKTFAGRQT